MFGGYCWMLRGSLLCRVEVGRYMFRLGKDQEAQALDRPGARAMDITGSPMGRFVQVGAAAALDVGLTSWIDLAARHVDGLPPSSRPPVESGGGQCSRAAFL